VAHKPGCHNSRTARTLASFHTAMQSLFASL
jgi:hypothetical protein